jgi:hypothetical protein
MPSKVTLRLSRCSWEQELMLTILTRYCHIEWN